MASVFSGYGKQNILAAEARRQFGNLTYKLFKFIKIVLVEMNGDQEVPDQIIGMYSKATGRNVKAEKERNKCNLKI